MGRERMTKEMREAHELILDIADDLLELIRDRRHGRARQMLCDALKRTKDPRAPDALIDLVDDDNVSGHAILALRGYGPKTSVPHLRRARPKLQAVSRGRRRARLRSARHRERLSGWSIHGDADFR